MTYSCCDATERHFDAEKARDELRACLEGKRNAPTRLLLDVLGDLVPEGASLLEVGGGVGVILHELMPASSRTASFVEVSSAYLALARQEAAARGYEKRVRFVHGDFVERQEEIGAADVVVLNRVICCYPDLEGIVRAAAARSRGLCAMTFPRDRWYVRLIDRWGNWRRRRRGDPFRTFIHSGKRVAALMEEAGFSRRYAGGTLAWSVEVYGRP